MKAVLLARSCSSPGLGLCDGGRYVRLSKEELVSLRRQSPTQEEHFAGELELELTRFGHTVICP